MDKVKVIAINLKHITNIIKPFSSLKLQTGQGTGTGTSKGPARDQQEKSRKGEGQVQR